MVKDPEALKNWPLTLSRDGARTPLPWASGESHAGFSSVDPWLPLGAAHSDPAVDRQQDDPESLLNLTRRLVALRAAHPALRLGANANWIAEGDLLGFDRVAGGEHVRCRSEEHTSELQSLMRISYAVFCLKKKNNHNT